VVGKHVSTYTPTKTKRYEERISAIASGLGVEPFTGPIEVEVIAASASLKPDRVRIPRPAEWKAKGADVDNVVKCALDAMNKILYLDDKQVVRLIAEKIRLPQGFEPGMLVRLGEAEDVRVTLARYLGSVSVSGRAVSSMRPSASG
jgi:Holliday junction resolvase RusA-like endonuclease